MFASFWVWLAVVPDQLWGLTQACLNVFFGVFRGLPSKSPEEEEKHRLQYEAMIEAAKRKGTSPTLIIGIMFNFLSSPSSWHFTRRENIFKKINMPVCCKKQY